MRPGISSRFGAVTVGRRLRHDGWIYEVYEGRFRTLLRNGHMRILGFSLGTAFMLQQMTRREILVAT